MYKRLKDFIQLIDKKGFIFNLSYLPKGKDHKDCINYKKCKKHIGFYEKSDHCRWYPGEFKEKK